MQITVQLRRASERDQAGGLLAYCSVIINEAIVIYDLKLVRGKTGLFVAMPTRKLTARHACGHKNEVTNRYCGGCGERLPPFRSQPDLKIYTDIVHPITAGCRRLINDAVMAAYERLLTQPDQVPPPPPDSAPPPLD